MECGERGKYREFYILGNVIKYSRECSQTFRGIGINACVRCNQRIKRRSSKRAELSIFTPCFLQIQGLEFLVENWAFDFSKRALRAGTPPKNWLGMFGNIPQNVWGHSLECLVIFSGMFSGIPRNDWRRYSKCLATFPECLKTFLGMIGDIPRNLIAPPFPAAPAFCSERVEIF